MPLLREKTQMEHCHLIMRHKLHNMEKNVAKDEFYELFSRSLLFSKYNVLFQIILRVFSLVPQAENNLY